jgi:hypothetical protein
VAAFTGGTVVAQAQVPGGSITSNHVDSDIRPRTSPQDALLAEALGAVVQAGFDPADFDFEKAVFDPQGRAVFLPVRATDEVRRQARAFVQSEQRLLLVGLLYARQPFEFQGKRYGRGLHPIVLENRSAAASTTKHPTEGPALFDGDIIINIDDSCNNSPNCTIIINVNPPPPEPEPPVEVCYTVDLIVLKVQVCEPLIVA